VVWDEDKLIADAKAIDLDYEKRGLVGPLHGIPLLLKDNINTTVLPTSAGTPALLGNAPGTDAPLATRLFSAGALLAGKGNLHELSSGGTSANSGFGPARNPYDLTRVPGGSSGGTAAAVAARIVPAGIGTDTAGSVRVPASLCGVIGFHPTTGRYPGEGIVPLSSSLDTAGPIARCIRDIVVLDAVVSGESLQVEARPLSTVRFGVARDLIDGSTDDVAATTEASLKALQDAGATLVPVLLEPIRELNTAAADAVIDLDFLKDMQDYLNDYAPGLSLQSLVDNIASPSAHQITQARLTNPPSLEAYTNAQQVARPRLDAAWRALHAEYEIDAVIFPTTSDVALPLDKDDNVMRGSESVFSWFYFSHTSFASLGRRPGISLPIGLSKSGLPVGLELDALPGKDQQLLCIALSVEDALPTPPAP
jgi:Asp-tRNA(Asn)/Glu-tRNA(Gln) amidotransferase A subunit family amidase